MENEQFCEECVKLSNAGINKYKPKFNNNINDGIKKKKRNKLFSSKGHVVNYLKILELINLNPLISPKQLRLLLNISDDKNVVRYFSNQLKKLCEHKLLEKLKDATKKETGVSYYYSLDYKNLYDLFFKNSYSKYKKEIIDKNDIFKIKTNEENKHKLVLVDKFKDLIFEKYPIYLENLLKIECWYKESNKYKESNRYKLSVLFHQNSDKELFRLIFNQLNESDGQNNTINDLLNYIYTIIKNSNHELYVCFDETILNEFKAYVELNSIDNKLQIKTLADKKDNYLLVEKFDKTVESGYIENIKNYDLKKITSFRIKLLNVVDVEHEKKLLNLWDFILNGEHHHRTLRRKFSNHLRRNALIHKNFT